MSQFPKIEKIVTEDVNGKSVQKLMHEDGSYSVQDASGVFTRYFKDGKVETYEPTILEEIDSDGTRRYYRGGRLEQETFPNGVRYHYKVGTTGIEQEDYPNHTTYRDYTPSGNDEFTIFHEKDGSESSTRTVRKAGKVVHHETNGVTDTILYRMKAKYLEALREKVGEKIKEREGKNQEAKKERAVENKTITKIKAALKSLFSKDR